MEGEIYELIQQTNCSTYCLMKTNFWFPINSESSYSGTTVTSDRSRNSLMGERTPKKGLQPINWPIFAKNCLKREKLTKRAVRFLLLPQYCFRNDNNLSERPPNQFFHGSVSTKPLCGNTFERMLWLNIQKTKIQARTTEK